ncbi:MAG: glycosyltransferase, partial [Saprospiraceae bacterium]|nr:glycosyltransferase [Saprospiraceae bacterium]
MHAHILLAVFIAATLVQLAAWIVIFARLALHRPTQNSKLKTQNSKLSVLICARNEAENLRKNLPAVLEQQYPDFEVLVVDDDSTDDTPAVLHFFQEKYPCLRVLRISPKTTPGKKHALAQGIAAARHEHLVFTDADCRPAGPEWLEVLSFEFRVTQNSKLKTQHSKPEILLG